MKKNNTNVDNCLEFLNEFVIYKYKQKKVFYNRTIHKNLFQYMK